MIDIATITRRTLAGLVLALPLSTPGIADQTPSGAAITGDAAVAVPAAPTLSSIRIEREQKRFVIMGRFIEHEQSRERQLLEYLAVKKGAYKSYEGAIELDTTATEFNLACILIGLDRDKATLPRSHFDPAPVMGDPVDVHVEWDLNGETRRVPGAELLVIGGQPVADNTWVYTGSVFANPTQYLAEQTGTLIGFIHDRDSIIEHRVGIGLGSATQVTVNRALLPPPGTPIRVIVRNVAER